MSADRPTPRSVVASLSEVFDRPVHGRPLTSTDSKAGARLERVEVDGEHYVLKHLNLADDWVMRATGDLGPRAVSVWRDGWLDRLPDDLDHTVVAAAWDDRADGRGAVLVMRDVGAHLVPEGEAPLPIDQHADFIRHMARLHARFWNSDEDDRLLPLPTRLVFFGPVLAEVERAHGGDHLVPTQLVPAGWTRLRERSPRVAGVVAELLDDPTPLVEAMRATPQTLVHGDWKAGNLGTHPDGRTILLDWALPGIAPGCMDLAFYVCLNRARVPERKEAILERYRDALEGQGVRTDPWWDRQCALSLLGTFLQFGWEKALGDDTEFTWWEARALEGVAQL